MRKKGEEQEEGHFHWQPTGDPPIRASDSLFGNDFKGDSLLLRAKTVGCYTDFKLRGWVVSRKATEVKRRESHRPFSVDDVVSAAIPLYFPDPGIGLI